MKQTVVIMDLLSYLAGVSHNIMLMLMKYLSTSSSNLRSLKITEETLQL